MLQVYIIVSTLHRRFRYVVELEYTHHCSLSNIWTLVPQSILHGLQHIFYQIGHPRATACMQHWRK